MVVSALFSRFLRALKGAGCNASNEIKYTLTLHSEGIGTHICLSQWIRIALIELIQ